MRSGGTPPVPRVTSVKYTNGADASNPYGSGVRRITPGVTTMTWTYRVQNNTGNTRAPRAQVVVTDDGPVPVFDHEFVGNGDDFPRSEAAAAHSVCEHRQGDDPRRVCDGFVELRVRERHTRAARDGVHQLRHVEHPGCRQHGAVGVLQPAAGSVRGCPVRRGPRRVLPRCSSCSV
jgi:hypothetical protein